MNLTRFNLQFPEKRDFFLEGQGMFQFGGLANSGSPPTAGSSGAGGSSDAPTIFYGRQIGLAGNRVVPIIGGGRLSGKVGTWSVGALNIASDADDAAKAVRTDFTVLRVRRDILGERSLEVVGHELHELLATQLFGVDGNFGFFQNVYLSGYLAKTATPGRSTDDVSYRTNFNYSSDRYGFSLDRVTVDPNFNPEIGFLARQNFRRNYSSVRFSPRPAHNAVVRRYIYEGGYNYETDDKNRLESREAQADYRIEFQNSDVLSFEDSGTTSCSASR